ncbi:MAG TPA: HDIG domain-containing protein, partial [Candidatus Krumholzibacterium sp.]|nr:HDIG domain-containing protein [Candidatus Krumholzibacterium sp.]
MSEQNPAGRDGEQPRQIGRWLKGLMPDNWSLDGKTLAFIYAIAFIVLSIILFPPSRKSKEVLFREGDIANVDVIAPFTFEVPLSEQEIEINRAKVAVEVPPVYESREESARHLPEDLEGFMERIAAIATADTLTREEKISWIKDIAPGLRRDPVELLLDRPFRRQVLSEGLRLQKELFGKGIINDASPLRRRDYAHITVVSGSEERLVPTSPLVEQGSLETVIIAEARNIFRGDESKMELFYSILRSHLMPNYVYDLDETMRRRQSEMAKVAEEFRVSENERIIAKHDKVTRKQIEILEALESNRAKRELETSVWNRILVYAGKILRIAILVLVLGIALKRFDRKLIRSRERLTLIFITVLFYLIITALIMRLPFLSRYLIPTAFVPLIATAFFGAMTALIFTFFASFMIVTHTTLPAGFVFISVLAGVAAIVSISQLRERKNFYTIFLYVSMAYIAGIVSFGLTENMTFTEFLRHTIWGIANGFICTILVMFLLPILESLFNVTTNFTLMELSDLNRPLLKRLIIEAPGTYHHSLLLGNMVEAAAGEVGANGLLARVMAYYHDIGKLAKPEYFFENKGENINKHEKLSPTMSGLILASHVKEGVELARNEKIPDAVIDGIREHHGTTVMAYFYNKALEYDSHDSVNMDDFRYPGPRPRSKETALIMLADSSEAAVRSLKEPSAPRIRAMISRIFESRMNEGELNDSGLTLNDIAVIKEKYIQLLTGIFHPRISYPKQEEQEREKTNE